MIQLRADSSFAVCRVCGAEQQLDSRAVVTSAQLANFTHAHSGHDRFCIDIVVHPPLELPEQRRAG